MEILKVLASHWIVWAMISVNLIFNCGHESLNIVACEPMKKRSPKVRMVARVTAIVMDTMRFILRLSRFTKGLSKMAMMSAKRIGTIISWPMYKT